MRTEILPERIIGVMGEEPDDGVVYTAYYGEGISSILGRITLPDGSIGYSPVIAQEELDAYEAKGVKVECSAY